MEKYIKKTRKDHQCCFCDKQIKSGSQAYYIEGRSPKWEKTKDPFEDVQIGIEYYELYYFYDGKNIPSCTDSES